MQFLYFFVNLYHLITTGSEPIFSSIISSNSNSLSLLFSSVPNNSKLISSLDSPSTSVSISESSSTFNFSITCERISSPFFFLGSSFFSLLFLFTLTLLFHNFNFCWFFSISRFLASNFRLNYNNGRFNYFLILHLKV